MNIIGPDSVAFGVDDVGACREFLTAYGLNPVDVDETGGFFEALDGTGVLVRHRNDSRLPPPLETANMLRQTVYGVADQGTVDAIADELAKDRQVQRRDDGSVEAKDDLGFSLKFQVTKRRELNMPGEVVNSPGSPPQRASQQDWRLGGHAGEAANVFAHCLLRSGLTYRGGVLCESSGLQGDGPVQCRPVPAPRGNARSSHALLHPDAGLHEGLRAFGLPYGRPDGAHAGRNPLRSGRIPIRLGSRAPQVRLELVLVLQQPARLQGRIRRGHGPARRRMGAARDADQSAGGADVPLRIRRENAARRPASQRARTLGIDGAGPLPARGHRRKRGEGVRTVRRFAQESVRGSQERPPLRLVGLLPALRRLAHGLAHQRLSERGARPDRVRVAWGGIRDRNRAMPAWRSARAEG